MKRNDLLIAGLSLLILSLSATALGFPGYSPGIWRKVGNGYTIRVDGGHPEFFFNIDMYRVKDGQDQPSLLVVSNCLTPEYQKNSKSIFLRMKLPPPELAVNFDDFEERRNAFDKEYWVEWNKWMEEIRPLGSKTGCEKFNESMKPFNDQRDSFRKELGQIQEAALPVMQQQDWSYYIIDQAKETVIGPLSEQIFLASKAVNGKKIHWKPAHKTFEEYSRSMKVLGLFIASVIYFPWFVLLLVIVGVIYSFCKRKKRVTLEREVNQ